MKSVILGVVAFAILSPLTFSQNTFPFGVNNRLRVEFDDNIFQTSSNEEDSLKIIEEIELIKNLTLDSTVLSLRYSPSFVWWENRDEDSTDLHHQADAILRHRLTETAGLNASWLLRLAELPELIESGRVFRENNDFLYNSLAVGLDNRFGARWIGDVEYKFNSLGYDEDEVADVNDYDQNIFGGSLRYEVNPATQIGGEIRFSDYDFEDDGRDADSIQYGAVLKRQVSDRVAANLRAGWETKDLDNANTSDADGAYVGGSFTVNPAEGTTFEVGANFSPAESPIAPYANQENTSVYARLNRALTPRIDWNIAGIYANSAYDAEETSRTVNVGDFSDGDEDILRLSTRLSYQINRLHAVEANYQFSDLSSDVLEARDFERNRVSLGWRLSL